MYKLYSFQMSRLLLSTALAVVLVGSSVASLWAQSVRQITNTTGSPAPAARNPTNFAVFNGRLYFIADSPVSTAYKVIASTDGTVAGTKLLGSTPIPVYAPNEYPVDFTEYGGKLYFVAGSDREVYATDGTDAGTGVFKDIYPGLVSGNPTRLTATDGNLYFVAVNYPANPNRVLWVSDGTADGTRRLADVVGVPVGKPDPTNLTAVGNKLFYSTKVDVPNATDLELWVTDGTAAGTKRVKGEPRPLGPNPNSVSFYVLSHFEAFNGRLIFRGGCPCTDEEPWISDGTPEGTVGLNLHQYSGVFIGAQDKFKGFTIHNNLAYFFANNPNGGSGGLWVTDGTLQGSRFVKALSGFDGATSFNGKLYFFAATNQLWVTDGTGAGTHLVKEATGAFPPNLRNLVAADGKLYFLNEPTTGLNNGLGELWESNGTEAGTRRIMGESAELLRRITSLQTFQNQVYLTAWPLNSNSPELFRLDDNHAPVAPVIPNQTITVNQPFVFTIPDFGDPDEALYDPEDKFLAYQVTGYPAGFSYFPTPNRAGQISGQTPLAGRYTITVTATDRQGASVSTTFLLIVNPAGNSMALQLLPPSYNCVTGAITFNTSGGDGSTITYLAPGIHRVANTDNFGTVEVGLRGDPKPILLQATQSGVTVSFTFDLPNACNGTPSPGPLQLLPPTYDCVTGVIHFNTRGGDGSTTTYVAPGISRGADTDASGVVEYELRSDPKPIFLTATQNGITVSYSFDLPGICSGARLGVGAEPGHSLSLHVLGNPVRSETVDVEIRGAEGLPLTITVSDMQGRPLSYQRIEQASGTQSRTIRVGTALGTYLLRVSTPTQHRMVKLLRQ